MKVLTNNSCEYENGVCDKYCSCEVTNLGAASSLLPCLGLGLGLFLLLGVEHACMYKKIKLLYKFTTFEE